MLQIFHNFFAKIFRGTFLGPYTRARVHTHIYIGRFFTPEKSPRYTFTIFNKRFLQNYLAVRYKVINFAPRYKGRKETTETTAANCIHAQGNDRNELRYILVL